MNLKSYLKIIIISLMSILSSSAFAGNPPKYFDSLSTEYGIDYSYVSPYMLKAMGNTAIDSNGISVLSSDITSIETISSGMSNKNDEIWKLIRSLKKEKDMETLSTKKKGDYRYDVLAKLSKDGKYLLNLMVITQNSGFSVNVVYIEGKIPMSDLSTQL
ncbi:MAG: DUF4252 domain-containing protein [Muribaculaceae bacterium]